MTIIAVNTRLARRLVREFDEAQQRKGLAYWEPPEILTWPGWLARLWDEAAYVGKEERVLLSAAQERVLWETVIRESDAGEGLLNLDGTAAAAADAWAYLHDWRLPRKRVAFEAVPDTEAFFGWMNGFRERLTRGGFITASELPGVVRGAADFIAGFDELTPVQMELLRGTPEYPVPAVQVRERWRVGCGDEIQAAAHWARERLERAPAARLGVVLVDLAARRAAVERVFEDVLGTRDAFHVSAPIALSDVPLVRAALLALKGDEEALARSPFFRHSAEMGARSDLLRRRGRKGRKLVSVALDAWLRKASGWSAEFSRETVESGWPGARTLSSEEYQALESWKDLLAEFARLDSVTEEMDCDAALVRLQRLAEDKGFGTEEQDEAVQVMGVLEAAGARFDALWIGGMHDGAWPAPAARNPFVPAVMQRSVADQYGFALRTTGRLLHAAGEVVCSWPLLNGEEVLRASPLITGLPERGYAAPVARPARVEWEELADDVAPPFAGVLQRGGTAVIVDQSLCAFRAFARHRLGARELAEEERGLSLRERGTVMHEALRLIWSELKSQRVLLEKSGAEMSELIAECVAAALDMHLKHRGKNMRAIEGTRMTNLLHEWLRMERTRPAFETGDMEIAQTITVGGLQVEVRMDRVDRYVGDGSLGLMDYKTGKQDTPKQWEGDRPEAPQLPLYSAAMTERVSSVMYARVAAGDIRLLGMSECGEGVKQGDMKPQIEEWRRVVNRLGAAFMRGEAQVDPLKKACERCDLQGLCRVSASESDE